MRRQFFPAVLMLLVFTVVTGLVYPLAVTGVAQGLFGDKADGSLVTDASGEAVGSSRIGQSFTQPQYFHPRPSAAGDGYDAAASSGSNLGPTNEDFLATVEERADAYRRENGLAADAEVPVDGVTASASGLDPDISVANARLQAPRVAEERGMEVDDLLAFVDDHTSGRDLGFLGETRVNVLELNLALDEASVDREG
ncbi:MAG: K(+)-transporting ATPase subunit C [Acidimicrobiales bacterium]